MDKKENFTTAIKDNEGFIYKIASVYTNNRDDKNDLIQEILFQLWKSFDSYKQKSNVSTWIYRVALNVALYQLRLSKKRVATTSIEVGILNNQEEENKDSDEKWKIFKQHIDDLNPLDKGIIMLYFDNKSYDEIAEIIGISKTNVGTKLLRIKEKLKSQSIKTYNHGI